MGWSSKLNLFISPPSRLLKEMGWQEDSENDETRAPLTEDEMREFQVISEQVRRAEYKFTLKIALPFIRTMYN